MAFDESKHPRADDGKFGSGSGSKSGGKKSDEDYAKSAKQSGERAGKATTKELKDYLERPRDKRSRRNSMAAKAELAKRESLEAKNPVAKPKVGKSQQASKDKAAQAVSDLEKHDDIQYTAKLEAARKAVAKINDHKLRAYVEMDSSMTEPQAVQAAKEELASRKEKADTEAAGFKKSGAKDLKAGTAGLKGLGATDVDGWTDKWGTHVSGELGRPGGRHDYMSDQQITEDVARANKVIEKKHGAGLAALKKKHPNASVDVEIGEKGHAHVQIFFPTPKKDEQMQASSDWLTMFNAVAEEQLAPKQSGLLPRNFKLTSPEPGVWVVHDVPIFYETVRDGDHYDSGWLGRAVTNAFQAEREDGHLPPMHVHHRFRQDLQAFAAGAFRVTGSRSTRYKGRQTTAIFADLIVTHENIAREIAEHRLMWRSPEVSFTEARVVSLALLDHEAPFFEGPVLTVETEEGTVPVGTNNERAFQMVADPDDSVVAFSRSGSLTRALFRDGDAMTYPIQPRRFENDDPKSADAPEAKFCDDKDAEEAKGVDQMMDAGTDAPGGSDGSGGTDAPGGTDQEKPQGFNDGEDSGENGHVGDHKADAENSPTGFGDDDSEDESNDGPPQIDGDGDADQGLGVPSENDADGQREQVDANGQPAGNPLLDAMQNTPATLEQSIAALGFLQSLVQKMKGGPAAGPQQAGVQPPAQPPVPTEGPSDQMSRRDIKQFSELQGKVTALEANESRRKKDASIATFADSAVERLKGTTVGQDSSLRGTLVQFANDHGLEAAQTYAEGLRKHAFAVAPSGGRTMSMLADDVPDELKAFQAEGPESYERASALYVNFQQVQAAGMCLNLDFKTFAEREAKGVTVPRHS